MLTLFRQALAFLTLLPVAPHQSPSESDLGKFPGLYPLVGLIIGLLTVLFFLLLKALGLAPQVAAVFLAVFQVFLTRGFHLDGLADCADALLSHKTLEKKFEILKDSHLGTFGVTAVVVDIFLKIAFISFIFPLPAAPAVLLLYPVWGRLSASVVAVRSQNARLGPGLGFNMVEYSRPKDLALALGSSALVSIFFGLSTFLTALLAALFGLFLVRVWKKTLGGVTGDLLGASVELGEIAALTFYFLWAL
ncbi:MAG: adenosylcobinamide-GDP ribazoletransferase [Deltaproteobacteria bacterium]|jgi:adenosylcobinamide-GDP ribazoletransferase|nr:adenosylcobinamide-GDP ribazoletransferase [Deltaproteobacteria bacterium]